jgi:hypothetical protein
MEHVRETVCTGELAARREERRGDRSGAASECDRSMAFAVRAVAQVAKSREAKD